MYWLQKLPVPAQKLNSCSVSQLWTLKKLFIQKCKKNNIVIKVGYKIELKILNDFTCPQILYEIIMWLRELVFLTTPIKIEQWYLKWADKKKYIFAI